MKMGDQIKSIIKYLVLLTLTVALGFWAIFYLIDISEKKNKADVPPEETPPMINELPDIIPPKSETEFVDLISPEDNYKIISNPYLPENYKKLSRRLALIGDFEIAILHI